MTSCDGVYYIKAFPTPLNYLYGKRSRRAPCSGTPPEAERGHMILSNFFKFSIEIANFYGLLSSLPSETNLDDLAYTDGAVEPSAFPDGTVKDLLAMVVTTTRDELRRHDQDKRCGETSRR